MQTPPWRTELRDRAKGVKPPSYINFRTLPEIDITEGGPLDQQEVLGLVLALRDAPAIVLDPLLAQITQQAEPISTRAFANAVLDVWKKKNYRSNYKWMLYAQLLLRDGTPISDLTDLIDKWMFGTSAERDRTALVLEVLRRMNTPASLTALAQYAADERSPKTREAAVAHLTAAANLRGTSVKELEDRIVPRYGLDEEGKRTFSYGPRGFELVLGEGFFPMLRDEEGKLHRSPPRPRKTDDADLVEQTRHTWKLLEEELKNGIRYHSKRHERHMVNKRTWFVRDWREYILEHPFMRLFARNLLWRYEARPGHREGAVLFHVSEDLSASDVHDETFDIPETGHISIAHPLDLTEDELKTWSNLFADYEKISPFQQLDRERFDFSTFEHDTIHITHFAGTTFSPRSLRTYFKYHGYDRGYSDSYLRRYYTKVFEGYGVRLDVELDPGLQVGSYEGDVEQHIASLSFRRVEQRGIDWLSKEQLALESVPEVLINEALRDVSQIQNRA